MIAPGSARPAGNVPRGSAYGLLAEIILTGVIPFLVMQSLVPLLKNGVDIWLNSLLPVLGATSIAAAIVTIGLYRRQAWYIGFVFAYGWLVFAGFAFGFSLALLFLLGIVPHTAPDLRFMTFVNIVEWLLVSPLAWLLLRMLRLRYWRPGSPPEQWEPADDVRPGKTLLMAWLERKK